MTSETKWFACLSRTVALLGVILIILPAKASAAHADDSSGASLRARPATAPAAVRNAPDRRARQRQTEERAVASPVAGKRDPFEVPPPPKADAGRDDPDGPLPPGVRGLVIGQLRLEGIVRDEESGSMIAVVTNGSNLAYFLHLDEDVYDGAVSRITPDAIYFQQKSRAPGDRSEARQVVLKLGSERQEDR